MFFVVIRPDETVMSRVRELPRVS
ncbi:MAG: hypothetical protein QOH78_1312, partial [Verrucomicrobiota bacterium]